MTNPQDTIARLREIVQRVHDLLRDDKFHGDAPDEIYEMCIAALSVPNHSSVGREDLTVDEIVDKVTSGFRSDLHRIMADKAKPDYRENLAVSLFEMAYQSTLCGWSDETRDYWLAKVDALALLPSVPAGVSEDATSLDVSTRAQRLPE